MRANEELSLECSLPHATAGVGKYRYMTALPPLSGSADKYALLLKYSNRARAAEARLASLPDDLLARFRREAVADPERIDEIADGLVAEDQKRRRPFGDPELDDLHRQLGTYGPDAQREFQQVLELLKGEADPREVFVQITGREPKGGDRPDGNRGAPRIPQVVETPEAREKRRRRAAQIADEIKKMRQVFGGEGPFGAEVSKVVNLPRESVANSNCEAVNLMVASKDEPEPASTFVVDDVSAAGSVTVPMAPASAIPQAQQRAPYVPNVPAGPLSSGPFLVAVVVVAVMSGAGLALKFPPSNMPSGGDGHAVASRSQQIGQEAEAPREIATRAAEADLETVSASEEETRAEEARKKAAEQAAKESAERRLIAEAAAHHEEEVRRARQEDEKAHPPASAGASIATDPPPKPEDDARRKPDEVEAALNLSEQDRKRVQAALTALGHLVPVTGYFGPITRAMITDWQKSQGLPPSGYLDASQLASLYAQPASAARSAGENKIDAQPPENVEAALNLSEQDRKRVQAALTTLGHKVPATGYFGPITRRMIAEWQKAQGLPPSGFLDATQLAMLRKQAVPPIVGYDTRAP